MDGVVSKDPSQRTCYHLIKWEGKSWLPRYKNKVWIAFFIHKSVKCYISGHYNIIICNCQSVGCTASNSSIVSSCRCQRHLVLLIISKAGSLFVENTLWARVYFERRRFCRIWKTAPQKVTSTTLLIKSKWMWPRNCRRWGERCWTMGMWGWSSCRGRFQNVYSKYQSWSKR